MRYRIEYADGRCCNFANSRKDLLDWLKLLKDEQIVDIRKTYKEHKQFEQALKDYPDTDTADTINQAYQRLLLWQQERELEAKRKEEQRRKEKEGEEKDSIKLPK